MNRLSKNYQILGLLVTLLVLMKYVVYYHFPNKMNPVCGLVYGVQNLKLQHMFFVRGLGRRICSILRSEVRNPFGAINSLGVRSYKGNKVLL